MNAKTSILLGVNVDHVATLRQARNIDYPDPIEAALIAEKNGVRSGILVDSVVDVVEVPEESVKQAISTLNEEIRYFVVGETTYKNNNVVLLDIGKVFEKISEGKIEAPAEIPNK